MLLVDILIGF